MIDHGAYSVEPWAVRERELPTDLLAASESVFALANGHIGLRGNLDEGEPAGLAGTYLNGFHEVRPLKYAESQYGSPEAGETVLNITDGKVTRGARTFTVTLTACAVDDGSADGYGAHSASVPDASWPSLVEAIAKSPPSWVRHDGKVVGVITPQKPPQPFWMYRPMNVFVGSFRSMRTAGSTYPVT